MGGGTLAFTDKNAGSGNKTVTASGITVSDGNSGSNYTVSYVDNTVSTINKAGLTVTAVDASRFVTQSDAINFNGVSSTGYVNGETAASAGALSGTAVVTRTSAGTDVSAGTYTGVLVPSGLTSSNYTLTLNNGNFQIIPAGQLRVTVPNLSATYGSAAVYSTPVAEYLDGSNAIITLGAPTVVGNQYTYSDGAGGTAVFTLNPVVTGNTAAPTSTAGQTRVGAYNIGSTNISTTSANFSNTISFQGSQTVTTRGVTASAAGVSKTYDGTTSMAGATVGLTGQIGGDVVSAGGAGVFASKNAGNAVGYSVSGVTLNGTDQTNYYLTGGTSFTGSNGVITPAALTLSTTAVTKTYDGTTNASGVAAVTSGTLFGVDALSGGSFAFTNKNVGAGNKSVTASGITVSDSNSGGNYTVSYASHTTSTINPASLTVSTSAITKTYDGNTSATGTPTVTSGALFGGDTLSGGSFAFTDKNVGAGTKTVTVSGVTVSDGNSGGNYTLTQVNNTTSTITPAALTVSGITAANKVYDATTAATVTPSALTGASGLIAGDIVTVSATGTFADKNVTNGKAVTLSSSYGGADKNNYTITDQATTTANITPAALTINAPTITKTYDGTTAATGTATITGTVYSGDSVTAGVLAFVDKNAGTGNKIVNASGYTVGDGVNTGNYAISYASNTVSSITPASLSASTSNVSRAYDGTTNANGVAAVTSGTLFGGDTLSGGSFAFTNKNVGAGNKTVTVSGVTVADGNSGGNYTVTQVNNATSTITPASLILSTSNVSKTYDGTTSAAGTAAVTSGTLFSGDTLSGGSFAFTNKNVGAGNKTVTASGITVSDGNSGGNYIVSYVSNTTSTINPASLSVSTNNVSRVYDGTTNASGVAAVTSGTLFGGDTLSGGSFAFTNKNVGAGNKTVTVSGISVTDGNSGSNYTITQVNNTTSTITPTSLTLSTSNVSKTYDGTTNATGVAAVASGTLFAGDTLTGGTFAFTNKNVGAANKTVTASGVTVADGNSGGNYTVSYANNNTSTITPAALTVTAPTVTKTYDGTTTAVGSATVGTLAGAVAGEAVVDTFAA